MSDWKDSIWYERQLETLLVEGDEATAWSVAREGVELWPESVVILLHLGHLQAARQDFAWARRTFTRVLDIEPENPSALIGLAQVVAMFGESDLAIDLLHEALMGDGRDVPEYHVDAGYVLTRVGEMGKALETFAYALDMDPSSADAAAGLGFVAAELGQVADAMDALALAVEIDPGQHEARSLLGSLLFMSGDPLTAANHWARIPLGEIGDPSVIEQYLYVRTVLLRVEGSDLDAWRARRAALVGDPVERLLSEVATP